MGSMCTVDQQNSHCINSGCTKFEQLQLLSIYLIVNTSDPNLDSKRVELVHFHPHLSQFHVTWEGHQLASPTLYHCFNSFYCGFFYINWYTTVISSLKDITGYCDGSLMCGGKCEETSFIIPRQRGIVLTKRIYARGCAAQHISSVSNIGTQQAHEKINRARHSSYTTIQIAIPSTEYECGNPEKVAGGDTYSGNMLYE